MGAGYRIFVGCGYLCSYKVEREAMEFVAELVKLIVDLVVGCLLCCSFSVCRQVVQVTNRQIELGSTIRLLVLWASHIQI